MYTIFGELDSCVFTYIVNRGKPVGVHVLVRVGNVIIIKYTLVFTMGLGWEFIFVHITDK